MGLFNLYIMQEINEMKLGEIIEIINIITSTEQLGNTKEMRLHNLSNIVLNNPQILSYIKKSIIRDNKEVDEYLNPPIN